MWTSCYWNKSVDGCSARYDVTSKTLNLVSDSEELHSIPPQRTSESGLLPMSVFYRSEAYCLMTGVLF